MFKHLAPLPIIMFTVAASMAYAGGEVSSYDNPYQSSNASASTRARITSLQAGLHHYETQAALAVQGAMIERRKKVGVARPVQDKFGDPMYTHYGPLAVEPGTPMYDGPRYAASFDRGYMQPMPDGNHRGYLRGRFSQAGIISRTDTTLGVAANNSYMQHGMQVAPGSMAPSAARVMINNP